MDRTAGPWVGFPVAKPGGRMGPSAVPKNTQRVQGSICGHPTPRPPASRGASTLRRITPMPTPDASSPTSGDRSAERARLESSNPC